MDNMRSGVSECKDFLKNKAYDHGENERANGRRRVVESANFNEHRH